MKEVCQKCGHTPGEHPFSVQGRPCRHEYCVCPDYEPTCTCVYVHGDNPRCSVHGEHYPVVFTAPDACEVSADGKVLICYRTASGIWHAPFARIDGCEVRTPSCFSLRQEIIEAIRVAEAKEREVVGGG